MQHYTPQIEWRGMWASGGVSPRFCLSHLVLWSPVQMMSKYTCRFGTLLGRLPKGSSRHQRLLLPSVWASVFVCLCVYGYVCLREKNTQVHLHSPMNPYGQTPQLGWESTCPNTLTFPSKLAGGLQKITSTWLGANSHTQLFGEGL